MTRPRRQPNQYWDLVSDGAPDACWPWPGNISNRGYGVVNMNGRKVSAHRYAYQLATGEDPGELHVCHTCDNPVCVNPAHLWLGTNADNVRDKLDKGRGRAPNGLPYRTSTHCAHGHSLTDTNLGRGVRNPCRRCARDAAKRSRDRKKAAA